MISQHRVNGSQSGHGLEELCRQIDSLPPTNSNPAEVARGCKPIVVERQQEFLGSIRNAVALSKKEVGNVCDTQPVKRRRPIDKRNVNVSNGDGVLGQGLGNLSRLEWAKRSRFMNLSAYR